MSLRTQSNQSNTRAGKSSAAGHLLDSKAISQVLELYGKGSYDEAEVIARKMTLQVPLHSFGWKVLGTVLLKKQRLEDSANAFMRAAVVPPEDPEIQNNLGNTYLSSGKYVEAEEQYRAAIALRPDYADAWGNLGISQSRLGRHKEAEAAYLQAIKHNPDYTAAYSNLCTTLQKQGRYEEAETYIKKALEIAPNYVDAYVGYANLLNYMGEFRRAEEKYRTAIRLNPEHADAYGNLAAVLHRLGKFAEAEATYLKALELNPNSVDALNNLGMHMFTQGRLQESALYYRRAIDIKPDFAAAYNNLANVFHTYGQYSEAELLYRKAIELDPLYSHAQSNLANALLFQGRPSEAVPYYRRAVELQFDYTDAFSNMLFCMTHDESYDAEGLFPDHVAYGERLQALRKPNVLFTHSNERNPKKCLRVGIVTDDFRSHPVQRFTEGILTYLSKDPHLTLHAYYSHPIEDEVTKLFKGFFKKWHSTAGLNNYELAQAVNKEGIDILIDLSGHTANNKLPAFSYKPAPIQASWMGYPGTTGLKEMDYYIADAFLIPNEMFASTFTEKLIHLPITATFIPSKLAPEINTLPALQGKPFTFGSFNRILKLSSSVIKLWAKILLAVPDARMMMCGMAHDDRHPDKQDQDGYGRYATLVEWFAKEGIEPERLSFHQAGSVESDMELNHQVDMCLDAFPYNGSTTTQNSLWMGVPTLTILGKTVTSRMGASIQKQLKLDEFIAADADDFVRKGIAWTENIERLSEIRAGMRERFSQSLVFQHEKAAGWIAKAWRNMWHLYCEGKSPESFSIKLDQE